MYMTQQFEERRPDDKKSDFFQCRTKCFRQYFCWNFRLLSLWTIKYASFNFWLILEKHWSTSSCVCPTNWNGICTFNSSKLNNLSKKISPRIPLVFLKKMQNQGRINLFLTWFALFFSVTFILSGIFTNLKDYHLQNSLYCIRNVSFIQNLCRFMIKNIKTYIMEHPKNNSLNYI